MSGPVYRAGAARRSAIARDLHSPKYRIRITESRKRYSRTAREALDCNSDVTPEAIRPIQDPADKKRRDDELEVVNG
jgi:hypothetical protein